jgi:hypothetical protein
VPAGRIFALGEGEEEISFESGALEGRLWLKRGDVHAIQEGDVVSVASPEALTEALGHFRANGIRQVLVQEHVDGDVVKFYGVGDRAFFRVFSASGEDVTDRMGSLQILARRAARAVGLEVYGGDAVIAPHGEIRLIDLNDWPSFSRCCESAGASIATYLVDRKPFPAA